MSDRTRPRFANETPIERIFEKVMRRKMTSAERLAFRLKPARVGKTPERKGPDRQAAPPMAAAKTA
jgi:hypothetical protein